MAAPRRGRHARPATDAADEWRPMMEDEPADQQQASRSASQSVQSVQLQPVQSAQPQPQFAAPAVARPPEPPHPASIRRQEQNAAQSGDNPRNTSRRRPRARRPQPSSVPNGRLNLWGCIRGEFVKLFALASTYWLMGITLVLLPAGAAMNAWAVHWTASIDPQTGKTLATPNPVDVADLWISVGGFVSTVAIVTGIFGVLAITAEYSTKSIQATLTANPKRMTMIVAKLIAVSLIVFLVSLAGLLISWAVVAIMSNDWSITQLSGREWRLPWITLFGGAASLTLMALLAFGVGAICRSTPGAVFAYIAILTILPSILSIVSIVAKEFGWVGTIASVMPSGSIGRFLQMNVSSALTSSVSYDYFVPNWWQSLLVLVGWTVVSVALGSFVIKRADVK
ncbi:ABC transporter permease subunit [Bifidobacterium callimiconis]|uniref:ABC transporter permease n=1 Tax=Bifidobacterium callimiconis TaxID=2306973 RepID=A0A430FDT4_9BIFI|nr:ABC transporter permease subunit [Bifidobacterium callimiconis]RSX50948.1 ABC transporter permease [Bifidobacterium callimiconis]